jgi:hypothetical protein
VISVSSVVADVVAVDVDVNVERRSTTEGTEGTENITNQNQ